MPGKTATSPRAIALFGVPDADQLYGRWLEWLETIEHETMPPFLYRDY